MSVRKFEMEMEVGKELFYNEDSLFGIYSVKPVHYDREVIRNKYGNVSLQGTTRKLLTGEKYDIKFEGAYSHAKYGDYYKIIEVEPDRLNTVAEQDKFLQVILTTKQFEALKKAYPDSLLVDMILNNQIDTKKTKGIKAKSLADITAKVKQNSHISILIAKLNELSLSTNAIDKLLHHFGSSELVLQAIEDNIYELCAVKTFGFKSVDSVALSRGDNPTNSNRIHASIDYLLKMDNLEGHTWSNESEILENSVELLGIGRNFVVNTLQDLVEYGKIYCEDGRVAIPKVREQELEIYEHLKRIRDSYVTVPNIEEKILDRIEEVEHQQGFLFTEEQFNSIQDGIKHGVITVNGKAGTGKTTQVKGLIDSLGTDNYMTAGLSGKSANILSKRDIKASTIHRMLGYQDRGFVHNESNPLPYSCVVVDEISMVDVRLLLSVLKAIPDGCKLILCGDLGQLPPIGIGYVLRDLLTTKTFPAYELTKVHRQAALSGILSTANEIREGIQIMPYDSSAQKTFGELQDQTIIAYSNKDSIPTDILKIARSYKDNIKTPEDLYDFQVIVANKERGALSVRSLNPELQKIFNDISKPFVSRNNYNYYEGDKIIANGNSYNKPVFKNVKDFFEYNQLVLSLEEGEELPDDVRMSDIFNGTMGYVHAVLESEKTVLIQFEDVGGLVAIHQNDMDKIDLAYVATFHKLQGSGVNDIVVAIDFGAYKLLSRQLVYTGITRGIRKGVLLAESKALHTAISNDVSGNRRTFLADAMKEDAII